VLDEPVAMLDPVARHDFVASVLTAAAAEGVSVLLSSHVLAELERVADYLILLSRGRVQVAGEVDDLLAAHRLARELETGTFRYAWTQGFGRWRWTIAKLVPLAITVAAAAGVFSLLFSWFFQPFFADGNNTPFAPEVFDLRGVAFAAWTLAAFAIGALAGLLIRRVVPAMAVTLAAYAGLALAAGLYLRQHYAVPPVTSNPNVPGAVSAPGRRDPLAGPPPCRLMHPAHGRCRPPWSKTTARSAPR
jgi:hypothetical protein